MKAVEACLPEAPDGGNAACRGGLARGAGLILVVALTIFSARVSHGGTPSGTLHYQGYLTSTDGQPVPDQSRSMTFRIWDAETGGSVLWSETLDVRTKGGAYEVSLGTVNPVNLQPLVPRWLGIQVGRDPEMSPRAPLSNTAYTFNADMVDGYHVFSAGHDWGGSDYGDGLARRMSFHLRGDYGPADLYVPIQHFWPFRIVLVCPHDVPQVGDVAYVECIENDGTISCMGVDGSGAQVRMSASLSSTERILSVRGGRITLSCPGDGSLRFKAHTQGEWALGYVLW